MLNIFFFHNQMFIFVLIYFVKNELKHKILIFVNLIIKHTIHTIHKILIFVNLIIKHTIHTIHKIHTIHNYYIQNIKITNILLNNITV